MFSSQEEYSFTLTLLLDWLLGYLLSLNKQRFLGCCCVALQANVSFAGRVQLQPRVSAGLLRCCVALLCRPMFSSQEEYICSLTFPPDWLLGYLLSLNKQRFLGCCCFAVQADVFFSGRVQLQPYAAHGGAG
jgi:hypothetical protein